MICAILLDRLFWSFVDCNAENLFKDRSCFIKSFPFINSKELHFKTSLSIFNVLFHL